MEIFWILADSFMRNRPHSISLHFVQAVLNAARRMGLDEQQLLDESGISPQLLENLGLRVTSDQFSRLMLAIWQLGDDEFMGLTPQRSRHGVFALMARQVVRCKSLGAVYYQLSRFYNLTNESLHLELQVEGDQARFFMRLAAAEQDADHLFREFFMLLWHRFPSWLIGQRIPLNHVGFDYPEPDNAPEYRLLFPCPTCFDQATNSLVFPVTLLNAPVVQTPATLRVHLKRAPLDWFVYQTYNSAYTRNVLDYLEGSPDLALTSIQEVAAVLHLTERTLRRKLAQEGTSFQDIKDGIRRDLAIHLLNRPALSMTEISRQLGFSEASAFTRAFRQWTGISPGHYRKTAQGKQRHG